MKSYLLSQHSTGRRKNPQTDLSIYVDMPHNKDENLNQTMGKRILFSF